MMRALIVLVLAMVAAVAIGSPVYAQSKSGSRQQQVVAAKSQADAPAGAATSSTTGVLDAVSRLLPIGDAGAAPGDGTVAGRIVQMAAVLTLLSAAPALLIMATSFTRFLIAFSFLRAGLGLQGAPANIVLITLALFMTFYVMSPALDKAWENGAKPLIENRIGEQEAVKRIVEPFEKFMRANVRDKDLKVFEDLAARKLPPNAETPAPNQLRTLIPAFIVSELRRGFEIGFLILLPFLVIDLLVATLVMSMGMMMLSPTVFSLPCKVLFFVLIDGWSLLVGGLVRSFV